MTNLLGKTYEGVALHEGANDCIMQREGEFHKCIFQ